MRLLVLLIPCLLFSYLEGAGQSTSAHTSSELLHQMKKLNVLGSALFIAAHPDDENTRLLAWLSNEKLYRTGYLSITRGDGGQNLIGDEQGVELGLIRTQELLAARRIDGAEQFFTSAFDFGYSKSPEETFGFWDHQKVLADVVWVIRSYKPDIIIARFPTTGEGGHGHHTASAILAEEAFDAAGDSSRFPEQFSYGLRPWTPQRLVWNTFNFGSTNTQREDQFKQDVGQYNALLGKSYGELAAESRSQHKSQGFGVPSQRGSVLEYFKTIRGKVPAASLMDDVDVSWSRVGMPQVSEQINKLISDYNMSDPSRSVGALLSLYDLVHSACRDSFWKAVTLNRIKHLIAATSGLYMMASTSVPYAVQGDSIYINMVVNGRTSIHFDSATVSCFGKTMAFDSLRPNVNTQLTVGAFVSPDADLSQPYWLKDSMEAGRFHWSDPMLTGKAESDPIAATFKIFLKGRAFEYAIPVQYKSTDPVKGELFAPLIITSPASLRAAQSVILLGNKQTKTAGVDVVAKRNLSVEPYAASAGEIDVASGDTALLRKDIRHSYLFPVTTGGSLKLKLRSEGRVMDKELRAIRYDHIPVINYHRVTSIRVVKADIRIGDGKKIGYIRGAGDKVPEALDQMGYEVAFLGEADMNSKMLRQYDAIVCGIRAYNTNDWLYANNEQLMEYVRGGGNLLVQYNTNSWAGPAKGIFGPYPFVISRNRITEESASVEFVHPAHPALNVPNRILPDDFRGWIQERSIYHADKIDGHYTTILRMNDKNEKPDEGSLIIAPYGRGNFVYTGLSFFRQLPAGVPGAYRLFANLIALPKN